MSRKTLWATLASALLFGSVLMTAQTPEVGQKAPEFSLSTPDGKPFRLSQFTKEGTVVLIVLRGHPGYQCPYCVKQAHDFIENANKFAALGAQVLLVYPGSPGHLDQHAREFLVKQNPLPENVHLVIDPDYTVTNQYGLRWDAPFETAHPSTFLIDKQDVIFFRKVSKGHGDRTSAADVLTELQRAPVSP